MAIELVCHPGKISELRTPQKTVLSCAALAEHVSVAKAERTTLWMRVLLDYRSSSGAPRS
eukprot:7613165-Alexandrium_andersonii.AAC.1